MDTSSFFITDKALFGNYPDQDKIKYLEELGVKYYVNLTHDYEIDNKYVTKNDVFNYPIKDRSIPYNILKFCQFIIKIANIITNLKNNDKIYIHCRGGHGRAGLYVSCLLCYIYDYSPEKSLKLTKEFHNNRKVMRNKWRKIGSPQTRLQKTLVFKLFKPLYFYKAYKQGPSMGLSNYSKHSIEIKNVGTFMNSIRAFYSFKSLNNNTYINKLLTNKTDKFMYNIPNPPQWDENKRDIMKKILLIKIKQYPEIFTTLINTGFRKIFYNSKYDFYWGLGDGTGSNELGKLWEEIREDIIRTMDSV